MLIFLILNCDYVWQDEDEEGDAVDMTQREAEEEDGTKVHDIKFDEYGIMDDGVDESTDIQLAKLKSDAGNVTYFTSYFKSHSYYSEVLWCLLKEIT